MSQSKYMYSVIIFLITISVGAASFNPKLTLDDCADGRVDVTVKKAVIGGIMYVQGRSQSCMQNVTSRDGTYRFNFEICGITWDTAFNMVVQKKAAYQTGEDKVFPLTCAVNIGQQKVSKNIRLKDLNKTPAQTKSIEPHASMQLLKDGADISGQTVTLSDTLTMLLSLSDQYTDGFDIKAFSCHASKLQIINNGCSVDLDLFPHLTRVKQGQLSAQFRAFRTTDFTGGMVQMQFWCLVEVCLGACQVTICTGGMRGYGKRSTTNNHHMLRDSSVHPTFDDHNLGMGSSHHFNVTVGSSVNIADPPVTYLDQQDENNVCMEKRGFVVMVTFLLLGLVVAITCLLVLVRKYLQTSLTLKRFHSDYLCVPSL